MLAFALSAGRLRHHPLHRRQQAHLPRYVYGARRAAFPPQINVLALAILMTSLLLLGITVIWQQRVLRQRTAL